MMLPRFMVYSPCAEVVHQGKGRAFRRVPHRGVHRGIVDGDAFVFSAMNRARYAGFPLGAEILQGLAWKITGRPEAANLVSFGAVPLFALILRRVIVDMVPVSQVARELGLTPNNAMVRLHRARTALKQRLQLHCGTTSVLACSDCGCEERGCCPAP